MFEARWGLMIYIFLLLLGMAVGSFINVLIDRLPRGEGVLSGRSRCEKCRTPLPWYDLVPLFSFVFLKGRCRFCGVKIPVRLPLVELAVGLGFVLVYGISLDAHRFLAGPRGFYPLLLVTYYLLVFSSFVVLFFTDLEYGMLPDKVVFPTTFLAFLWLFANSFESAVEFNTKYLIQNTKYYLFPALGLSFFFLFLILVTRGRGMGFGDVKLGFLIGLVLGWPETLVAAFLAFLFGGIISAILLVMGKKHFGEEVPFGPFLIAATGIAAVLGSQIWEWYLGML